MKLKKTTTVLLLIVLLALILRLIVANNLHINADETVYTTHAMGFIDSGRISVLEQSPVYYYLLDIVYSLFGVSAITSRLLSIIGGALSVVLIFFITKRFYTKQIGLLAAFLFAISGFSIAHNVEMDMFMFFFILLSMYFLIKSVDEEEKVGSGRKIGRYMILSICSYLIAVLIKPLAIPAIVPLAVYYFYNRTEWKREWKRDWEWKRKWKLDWKQHAKVIGAFIVLSLLMLSPILTYNYILYKEKGITDAVFSQYLGLDVQEYEQYGVDKEWTSSYFTNKFKGIGSYFLKKDFFIVLLGLFGAFVSIVRHKNKINYLLIPSTAVFLYFMGAHGSPNHYIMIAIALSIYAAIGIRWLIAKKKKFFPSISIPKKKLFIWVLIVIFAASVFAIKEQLTEKAATNKLQEYFSSSIEKDALIIFDPRIYIGSVHWTFSDFHFVQADDFSEHSLRFKDYDEKMVAKKFYFVECVSDNCGWGRMFNEKGKKNIHVEENIISVYKEKTDKIAVFSDNLKRSSYKYAIYKGKVLIPENYLNEISVNNGFFSYPFHYKGDEFSFDYMNHDKLDPVQGKLYQLSKVMLGVDSLIALIFVFSIGFILFKREIPITKTKHK